MVVFDFELTDRYCPFFDLKIYHPKYLNNLLFDFPKTMTIFEDLPSISFTLPLIIIKSVEFDCLISIQEFLSFLKEPHNC